MNMESSIMKLQQLLCFIYGNILKTGWAAAGHHFLELINGRPCLLLSSVSPVLCVARCLLEY